MQKKINIPVNSEKGASSTTTFHLNGRPRKTGFKKVQLEDPPDNTRYFIALFFIAGLAAIWLVIAACYWEALSDSYFSNTKQEPDIPQNAAGLQTEENMYPLYLGYDKATDTHFIDNAIIVFFRENTTAEQIQQAATLAGGIVNTRLSAGCYRIWFPKSHDYQELNQLCELTTTIDCVDRAAIDIMLRTDKAREGDRAI